MQQALVGGGGERPLTAGRHSASLEVSMLHMVAAEDPPTIAISTITTTTCAKTLLLVLAMALPLSSHLRLLGTDL